MRSIMRNMAFMAVALLYIVSTMGYGVHKCSTDGTASLILLFGEAPCNHDHHHSDDCCSTNVYVLTEDQNISIQDNSFAPDFQIIDSAPAVQMQVLASVPSVFRQPAHYLKVFPHLDGVQASLCTFRI